MYLQVSALKDVVEDMLTRLEEFQTFAEMVNAAVVILIGNLVIEMFWFYYSGTRPAS